MLTSGGEKILIHTSNFRKVKRIPDVMKTFRIVREQIPAKLMMVGDGPQRNHAEALCREFGLCDDVFFLGNQNKVEEIYSIGDLFLIHPGMKALVWQHLKPWPVGFQLFRLMPEAFPNWSLMGKPDLIVL